MQRSCLVVLLTVALHAVAIPVGDDNVPPMALKASQIHASMNPRMAPKIVKTHSEQHQVLVQQQQNYVDADGDEHVATLPHPPRGTMGSTDHLKDDQFFLNIPFSEVEFDSLVNVTWVRPLGQMSKLDYVGLYQEDDADDAIPCNWEFAVGEEGSGSVRLQMTNHGSLEIRYFDVAADKPRVRVPILVHPPCPNNCTNHGMCQKGKCVCFSPYKGEECCEVGGKIAVAVNTTTAITGSKLHITLTPPAGSLDKRNWIGLFHNGPETTPLALVQTDKGDLRHQLIQTQATDLPTPVAGDNGAAELDEAPEFLNATATPPLIWRYVNETLDIPLPYIPGEYILKVIKNVENHTVIGTSAVIYIHGECPNGCSGHGECVNGTCVCNEGYDHNADCSVGDGLVVISVSPKEIVAGEIITVTWERNSDGGFSNLDYLALYDEKDTTYDAPFAYQFAQPEEVKVAPIIPRPVPTAAPPGAALVQIDNSVKPVDRGVIEFNAPSAKAKFVVRYFRKDHTLFSASEPIEVFFDCPIANCTGHGQCIKGECKCDAGWKSFDCSVGDGPITIECSTDPKPVNSNIDVKWSRPAKIGSIYDFIGVYAAGAANDQPLGYQYASTEDGSAVTGTVKLRLPSKKGMYELRYIDAFSRETVTVAGPIDVHLPCPNACSGHGTCQKDMCVCNTDWTARDDCSAKVGLTELTASPLHIATPSDKKITVTFKRPEGSGSVQDFIGLFPKSQSSQRHPIDFVAPTADFGTVSFSVPHYPGIYQARYIAGPNNELKAHSVDIDVTQACLNDCSSHGNCNRGTCECIFGWGGVDCSIGQGPTTITVGPHLGNPGDKLLVTYSRPVNNGGASDLLAIYYKDAKDMSTPLGFVMATDNDDDTVETKMPSVEAELEVHYIRGTDQKSLGKSSIFKVVFPCKDSCNGHGSCTLGLCTCQEGYDGFACEKSVPTAFAIKAETLTVEPLGNIVLTWQAIPKKSSPSDLIALYSTDDEQSASPFVYEYSGMKATGTSSLMAPYQPGAYVARYIGAAKGYNEALAQSEVINVVRPPKQCKDGCNDHGSCNTDTGDCLCEAGWAGPSCAQSVPTEWAVSTDSTEYGESHWIEASWTRPPNSNGNHLDMVGIFETGPTRKLEAIQFQYVGLGNQGKLMFRAPSPRLGTKQTYELKFVNGASGQPMATSRSFDVVKSATKFASAAKRAHSAQ